MNKPDPFRTLDDPEPQQPGSIVAASIQPGQIRVERWRLMMGDALRRPNIWHRFWTRVLLGWRWEKL